MLATALVLGGNIRVGLEDNLYLPSGEMAKSNGELVEVAARMVRDVGRKPATVEQAREILGLAGGRMTRVLRADQGRSATAAWRRSRSRTPSAATRSGRR